MVYGGTLPLLCLALLAITSGCQALEVTLPDVCSLRQDDSWCRQITVTSATEANELFVYGMCNGQPLYMNNNATRFVYFHEGTLVWEYSSTVMATPALQQFNPSPTGRDLSPWVNSTAITVACKCQHQCGIEPLESKALSLWVVETLSQRNINYCWRKNYGRTAGTPLVCKPDESETAGLCYKEACPANYTAVLDRCYVSECPAGFRDDGLYCAKPGAYGRGAGYTSEGACASGHPDGCEKNGLLWYPKCQANFHSVGCCTCSPSCPDGWTDIGVSCTKPSYSRGVGKVGWLWEGLRETERDWGD